MDNVRQKIIIAAVIVISIIGLLMARLVHLQLFESRALGSISNANSLRRTWIQPPRGRIFDRNGQIMVDNQPLYTVKVIPYEFDQGRLDFLAQMLDMPTEALAAAINKGTRYNRFAPVTARTDVPEQEMMRLHENLWKLQGVLIEVENKRKYATNSSASHLLGYLSLISPEQLENMKDKGYTPDDKTGSKGLEYQYEELLRGEKGIRYELVNAVGKVESKLDNGQKDLQPKSGHDLLLTIDNNLQEKAENLLRKTGKSGTIVAIDPQSGGILAMTSQPDYDLEVLNGRTLKKPWLEIITNPDKPLFNRAIQATYPPGSIYKLLLAIAALEEKKTTPARSIYCSGVFKLGRGRFLCHGGEGHGHVNLRKAITESCNTYFYELIFDVGFEAWTKYGDMFGFGRKTGIDIPGERSGILPSAAYYDKRYGKGKWTKGYLVSLSIGQGELNTTPLQLARFTAAIANQGTLHQPHLASGWRHSATGDTTRFTYPATELPISKKTFSIIRDAMVNVVEDGTGRYAAIKGIKVAGKTGTAQNPHGKDHAWFTAFAPADNPRIAVVVLVENAGYGGSISAPIAREIIQHYLTPREQP